jgi:hypothetical protein
MYAVMPNLDPLNLETEKINLANGLPAYEITITQNESVPNAQKCNCKGYELITGSNDIVYHFVYRDYAHFDKYLAVVKKVISTFESALPV